MQFEEILNSIYTLNAAFSNNINDEFGADILENEIADLIQIGIEFCEVEKKIYNKIREVESRLSAIEAMVPLC